MKMVPTITAKMPINPGEDVAELIAKLQTAGYQPRLSRSQTKLHVPLLPMSRPDVFRIPEQAENASLLLEAKEFGGRNGNSGYGVVICDSQDRPLNPFQVTTKSNTVEGHAQFASPDSIVVVQARYSNAKLDIIGFDVTPDYPVAWLDRFSILDQNKILNLDAVRWHCTGCAKIFRGQMPQNQHQTPKGAMCEGEIYRVLQLPSVISQFEDAIKAAIAKASCQKCNHVHYKLKPGA
ncbi:MAG: hypothetical protein Q8O59_02965 [bacterium]|nr:hypothetical protein [bacterium]